jgi:hypothetical protein
MKFVQNIIWIVATLVTIVVEMVIRTIILFPLGLLSTILAAFFGAKSWLQNNRFLDYCCPWKLGSKNLPVSAAVSRWFDPEF